LLDHFTLNWPAKEFSVIVPEGSSHSQFLAIVSVHTFTMYLSSYENMY